MPSLRDSRLFLPEIPGFARSSLHSGLRYAVPTGLIQTLKSAKSVSNEIRMSEITDCGIRVRVNSLALAGNSFAYYGAGFQPWPDCCAFFLGLRPRLVLDAPSALGKKPKAVRRAEGPINTSMGRSPMLVGPNAQEGLKARTISVVGQTAAREDKPPFKR